MKVSTSQAATSTLPTRRMGSVWRGGRRRGPDMRAISSGWWSTTGRRRRSRICCRSLITGWMRLRGRRIPRSIYFISGSKGKRRSTRWTCNGRRDTLAYVWRIQRSSQVLRGVQRPSSAHSDGFTVRRIRVGTARRSTSSAEHHRDSDGIATDIRRNRDKLQQITHLNDALLAQLDLPKMESFWFTAADETKLRRLSHPPAGI